MAVSGVEQVVEQEVEQEVVGCVALLGLLEPVELQLSLPCRQACSGSKNYILEQYSIIKYSYSLSSEIRSHTTIW